MRDIRTRSGNEVTEELMTGKHGAVVELDAIGRTLVSCAIEKTVDEHLRHQRLQIVEPLSRRMDSIPSAILEILRMD